MNSYLFLFLFFFSFLSGNSFASSSIPMSVVEVSGKTIPSFLQKEISKMSVAVFTKGEWKAIPYQIDEKAYDPVTHSRRWVLEESFSRRTNLSKGDKSLNEDEVILFMEKDMGEKASTDHLPPATQVLEVESHHRYAYLFYESQNPLKSSKSYIQYRVDQDSISADGYEVRFNSQYPIIQESLLIKNGSAVNVLDRFKVRALLAIRNFFNFEIEEEGITSRKVGYRLGPIRLIRRTVAYKSLGPIRVSPKAESDFIFYPYYIRIPSQLNNPLDGPTQLTDKTRGFAGFDFNKNFYGSKFYTERNPKPVLMNGVMSDDEKSFNLKNVTWWTVQGEKGSMMVKVEWDPILTQRGLTCDLYYKDDRTSLAPPESDPGELIVGFQLDYSKMPAGKYTLYLSQIFPPHSFSKTEVANLIQQAIRPPSITILELKR